MSIVRRIPQFPPHTGFFTALRSEVDREVAAIGRARDAVRAYAKSAFIVLATIALYAAYLWLDGWTVMLVAMPLGLAMAAIGFNIQHDGGHEALSRSRFINRCAAFTLDLVGGSSYIWRWKHNLYHHSYTNVGGVDADIELAPVGRVAQFQPRKWFHRYQHIYLWALYGLLPAKWHLRDDFRDLVRGRIGEMPMQRPRGGDLVTFIAGKVAFFTLMFALPIYVHGFGLAIAFYAVASMVLGVLLSVVFQLAHCVEETSFHAGGTEDEWAVHQLSTTADFAPRSRFLRWYLGGLNFQVEHHLFPRISHVHYARIAPVVRRVCEQFQVPYLVHETLGAAIRSHYRLLRQSGRAMAEPAAA